MAATLTRRQTDAARDHIKTNRIVEELQKYIDGERKMEPAQVRAAQILLDRTLPCLSATTFLDEAGDALPILRIVKNARPAA